MSRHQSNNQAPASNVQCLVATDPQIISVGFACGFFFTGLLLGLGNLWSGYLDHVANASLLAVCLLACFSIGKNRLKFRVEELLLCLIFLGYIAASIQFSEPTPGIDGELYINSTHWWMNFAKMGFSSVIAGILAQTRINSSALLLGFCASPFILVVTFAAYSIAATGEAKCGAIINVLDASVVNSAGLMNLLVYLPCFIAGWIFLDGPPRLALVIAAVATYLVATVTGCLYSSRTVILTLWFIIPAVLGAFAIRRFRIKNWERLMLGVFLVLAALGLFQLLKRPVNLDIVRDARFTMYLNSFMGHLAHAPFQHSFVDPKLVSEGKMYIWFHNFFADAHRLSGLWGFVTAIAMVAYCGTRIALTAVFSSEGKVLTVLFIVTFLILNTSIVPEGEFQPVLLILLLGGCAESLRCRKRHSPGANPTSFCPPKPI